MTRGKRAVQALLLVAAGMAVAILAWWAVRAEGAPAPFAKPARGHRLSASSLAGSWDVEWGTVRCRMHLAAGGQYTCEWCGTRYVGSWGIGKGGRLWITEAAQTAQPQEWTSYAIRLKPGTLSGPIEVGASGVDVHLKRRKQRCKGR